MSTDLTLYTPPSASDLEQSWRLAERIAKTEFVPVGLRGKPEAVLACILAGRELGVGPMQALSSIHIIQGRPTMSADLMVALVRRHGHRIRTIERTDEKAVVEGIRADDPDHIERVEFTMADARRAKLNTKENWQHYPAAMLWARAVSALCRIAFNDVLHGVAYTPEELNPDTPASTTVEAGAAEVDGVVAQFEADGAAGAATLDPDGLPLPEIIAAVSQADQAKWLLQQPDLADEYREAVKATVEGEGLSWPSFWRTAAPAAWRLILERALAEFHDAQALHATEGGDAASQTTRGGSAPPPAPGPTSDPAGPHPAGSGTTASAEGQDGNDAAQAGRVPPKVEATTSRRSATSPAGRRGQRSRQEVPGSASAGDLGEGPPAGPDQPALDGPEPPGWD